MAKKTLTKDDLINVGYDLAAHMVQAEEEAEQSKRKFIMSVVSSYHMPEQVENILVGVVKYYTEKGATDGTIRVRKAEIKTIFDAVGKTEVTGENLQKLSDFTGGYNAWVAFARELRGVKERVGGGAGRVKVALTEKEQNKVHELIGNGSQEQLKDIAIDAVKNIVAHSPKAEANASGAQLAGEQTLQVIHEQARLLSESKKFEQLFRSAGAAVLDALDPYLKQLEAAKKEAQQVQEMARGEREAMAA